MHPEYVKDGYLAVFYIDADSELAQKFVKRWATGRACPRLLLIGLLASCFSPACLLLACLPQACFLAQPCLWGLLSSSLRQVPLPRHAASLPIPQLQRRHFAHHTQVGPDVPTFFMHSDGVLERFTVVYIKVRG